MALFGTVSSVGTLGPVRFAWALIALLASARQQRPLLPHEDLPHTHKPRDFTTRDDVEKKHRAPEPRSSPTLKLRPQRATPSTPKATMPRPLGASGTSREGDLLLAQPSIDARDSLQPVDHAERAEMAREGMLQLVVVVEAFWPNAGCTRLVTRATRTGRDRD